MGFMVPGAEKIDWRTFDLTEGRCDSCGKSVVPLMFLGESDGRCEECFEPGWYANLSASGYMDQTDWSGPFATADAALAYVMDFYEVDEDGDELDENEVSV